MRRWFKSILMVLNIMIFGILGGQKNKSIRRHGIPFIVLTFSEFNKKAWPFIFLIIPLTMGYGEDSLLMRWLGSDTLVRAVYAVLLSLPFLFYGWKRWLAACLALVAAFQVHAGSLGQVWGMDMLVEDVIRYLTLGVLIVFNVRQSG